MTVDVHILVIAANSVIWFIVGVAVASYVSDTGS